MCCQLFSEPCRQADIGDVIDPVVTAAHDPLIDIAWFNCHRFTDRDSQANRVAPMIEATALTPAGVIKR